MWGDIGSAISSGISGLFSSPKTYSALLGGGLSYLGARESSKAAIEAGRQNAESIRQSAAAAAAQAQPFSVGSLGGTTDFDEASRTAILNLSPDLQNIYQGLLDRSGMFGGQATALSADPFAAADLFYQQQQKYFEPREQQLRTDAETRLMAQGRLGSTGGQRALGEIEESILSQQNMRQAQSFSQAQQLINSLLGRESGDLGQAQGLLNIPLQQANIGMGVGATLGTAASSGLQSRVTAAGMQYQPQAISPGGSALNAMGGLFLTPQKEP